MVAHGVSRGVVNVFLTSPGGAIEIMRANFLSPLRGFIGLNRQPTASAVGYYLTPLRG